MIGSQLPLSGQFLPLQPTPNSSRWGKFLAILKNFAAFFSRAPPPLPPGIGRFAGETLPESVQKAAQCAANALGLKSLSNVTAKIFQESIAQQKPVVITQSGELTLHSPDHTDIIAQLHLYRAPSGQAGLWLVKNGESTFFAGEESKQLFESGQGGQAQHLEALRLERRFANKNPKGVLTTHRVRFANGFERLVAVADGGTLKKTLGGAPPVETRLKYTLQLLQLLKDLERSGVVHRSLRPEHIVLEEGELKLIHFDQATEEGSRNPTPCSNAGYQPENLMKKELSSHTLDLYAMRCVIEELWQGVPDRPPFIQTLLDEMQPERELSTGSEALEELQIHVTDIKEKTSRLLQNRLAAEQPKQSVTSEQVEGLVAGGRIQVGETHFFLAQEPDESIELRETPDLTLPCKPRFLYKVSSDIDPAAIKSLLQAKYSGVTNERWLTQQAGSLAKGYALLPLEQNASRALLLGIDDKQQFQLEEVDVKKLPMLQELYHGLGKVSGSANPETLSLAGRGLAKINRLALDTLQKKAIIKLEFQHVEAAEPSDLKLRSYRQVGELWVRDKEHSLRIQTCDREDSRLIFRVDEVGRVIVRSLAGMGGFKQVFSERTFHLDGGITGEVQFLPVVREEGKEGAREVLEKEWKIQQEWHAKYPNLIAELHTVTYDGADGQMTQEVRAPFYARGSLYDNQTSASDQERRRWTLQMLQAVNALHQESMVHRDLKQENFLIDDAGNCRLSDFGTLTRSSEVETFEDDSVKRVGTAEFLAPEIRECYKQSSAKDVVAKITTPALDLFSLGKTLQQLWEESMDPFGKEVLKCAKKMQRTNPKERPSAESVFRELTQKLVEPALNTQSPG